MATAIQLSRKLSTNESAVRRRQHRLVEKEKKRRSSFVHEYVRTKYPNIFNEANHMYQTLMDKYPQKYDFTKLYYFKKWQEKIDQSRTDVYVPHLPILLPPEDLCAMLAERGEEPGQHQSPQQEQEESDQRQPDQQEEQQSPQQEQEESDQRQPDQQEEQQSPQQGQEEPQTGVQGGLFSGMSIDEMSIAAEEIVKSLQSDRELMDIVENFDLPAGVWDNELAIPDYVLESDLEW